MGNDEKITGNLTFETPNEKYNINISKSGLMKAGAYSTLGSVIMGASMYAVYRALRWAIGKIRNRFGNREELKVCCNVDQGAEIIDIPKRRGRPKKNVVGE